MSEFTPHQGGLFAFDNDPLPDEHGPYVPDEPVPQEPGPEVQDAGAPKDTSVFGLDLFGNEIKANPKGLIAKRFIFPPFSVLNAREGEWQRRKRGWLSLGIKSEIGRGAETYNTVEWLEKNPMGSNQEGLLHAGATVNTKDGDRWEGGRSAWQNSGTSVFDPVLCELAYTWFAPKGGQVVDPFAGGSVRGIVASLLGYKYWGCDLSVPQIAANYEQGEAIIPEQVRIPIVISGPMLRQKFHACTSDFIKGTCRGHCCEHADGISVIVHETEQKRIEGLGATVKDGYIMAGQRGLCPFKTDDGFCTVHEDKPLGCKASPFTFNDNGLLIVRNRYRMLKCYDCVGTTPAYEAHRWSLEQILGEAEAGRVSALAADGAERIEATMPVMAAKILVDNHNDRNEASLVLKKPAVEWLHGDSLETLFDAPEADFIFTCPPYGDLEVYSDNPLDISNMEYHTFLAAYKRIMMRAAAKLKPNRFACVVVGDFRDTRTGNYRNFVSDTIATMQEQGLGLYNEAILVTAVGSLPVRITKQFEAGRKLGKTHQNILVFIKGDWRLATKAIVEARGKAGE